MKRQVIYTVIAVILTAIITSILSYNVGRAHVYSAQVDYFIATEALLDSTSVWSEDFMDTVMETDVYYDYEVAREKLFGNN